MSEAVPRVKPDRLAAAASLLLEKAGAAPDIAREVAENLVDAEACGHASHGLRLVTLYVERLLEGEISGQAHPRIHSADGPILRIDGQGAFGQIVGAFAARHGIDHARRHGIAAVTISGSGHFGRNGKWPELAADQGVASLHFINAPGAPSSVVPHGGRSARLTSNPIAFGAPRPNGAHVIADFATGDFSVNAIKLAQERGERLPRASILRADGTLSDDPADFLTSSARAMLPFGGFKGFSLAVFVEILAGALTGGKCHRGDGSPGSANNMFSIYLDVARIARPDTYEQEVDAFLAWLGSAGDAASVPGIRSRTARETARRSGIPLYPALRQGLFATGIRLLVESEIASLLEPP